MKLSIIAVNWWGNEWMQLLAKSVYKNISEDQEFELIIMDNSGELTESELYDIMIIKPMHNLGHGKGLDTAMQEATGEYIAIMDIDAHILLEDWDKKLISEFESKDIKLAGAMDGGLMKPMRPLFMMFKKEDILKHKISFSAVTLGDVKFDVGVHAYFRFLTLFGDRSILKLPSKKTEYKDVLDYIKKSGCSYFFNEVPFDFFGLPTPK